MYIYILIYQHKSKCSVQALICKENKEKMLQRYKHIHNGFRVYLKVLGRELVLDLATYLCFRRLITQPLKSNQGGIYPPLVCPFFFLFNEMAKFPEETLTLIVYFFF